MLPAFGLYSHIRNNNIKSVLLLIGFGFLIVALWYAGCLYWIADMSRGKTLGMNISRAVDVALNTWFVPSAIVTGWFAIAFAFNSAMIRAGTGAKAVTRMEEPRLYNIIENLTITAGLPLPKIEIMETDALNAYAAGLSEKSATVAVTRGLLNRLDDRELAAVIAHELTHVKNRDVRLMVVATIFAGMITLIGEMVIRTVFSGSRSSSSDNRSGKDGKLVIIAVAIAACTYVFALLLQFAISRSREYLADAGAVELTKDPDAMISALLKVSGHDQVPNVPQSMQAMMISRSERSFFNLFGTHPALEDRIDRLVRFAGGRIPAYVETPHLGQQFNEAPKPMAGPWADNNSIEAPQQPQPAPQQQTPANTAAPPPLRWHGGQPQATPPPPPGYAPGGPWRR